MSGPRHPPGLWVCCATEFWERFSYYGMRALLVFYLLQHWRFTDSEGYLLYGAYTAMAYMTPVLGGLVADRYLGARKAVILGAVLLMLGHFGMAFEGKTATVQVYSGQVVVTRDENALQVLYLSLALIATGVGFLKPNATALVGRLYAHDDPRREQGFTLFYVTYNVGAFVAPLLCGWIGYAYGWRYGFGLAGLGMLAGLLVFLHGQRYLQGQAEPPRPEALAERVFAGISRETFVYAAAAVLVGIAWLLLRAPQGVGHLLWLFGSAVGILILYFAFARCTPVERDRLLVCAVLIVATIGFWALYEQQGTSLAVLTERMVDRGAFGIELPAPVLQSLNPLFVLFFAPAMSGVWLTLARRGREPSTAIKFALALGQVALAFFVLALGLRLTPAGEPLPLLWLVASVLLMTTGELCLAPVGLAMVTRLAPQRIVGAMTGAFFLAYSAASFISGRLAQLTDIPTEVGVLPDRALSAGHHAAVYAGLGIAGLGVAAALFLISPWLKRRMHESARVPAGGNPTRAVSSGCTQAQSKISNE